MRLGQVDAGEVRDLQSFDSAGPLLANILPLGTRQAGEEIVEIAVAAVDPVELAILADQPARRFEQWHLARFDKGRVGGGQVVALDQRFDAGDQRGP